ncbi:GNAT family N-acetyltransferase [Plastoroseomonas arctica]|uniref:GNAT family N-acetyltransferase n=1 Tax=Plastoroseomonas arctica TaxID=1509237 RepID=A0AAF1JZC8_9PROT|nr:GNAT family N-acetyltransferase [Plastoroseomonas arctica]MBR0656635.1 GNAT family N-acetyltransferase [Plastoroseomonas arctica]
MDQVTLQGPRLILRPWQAGDTEPLYILNGDADAMRHFPFVPTRSESDAWAARLQAHIATHGWGFWVAAHRATGDFLGVVGLMHVAWEARFTPAVEIGWRITPAQQRHGYAEEAARLALGFAFDTLRLPEIVAFTIPANEPSWRLMEKLGMRADGRFEHPRVAEGHPKREHLLYRSAIMPGAAAPR